MATDPSSIQPVDIRDVVLGDYGQICSLMERYGLETKPYEEWAHLWRENPALHDYPGRWPLGWVLEADRGHIAGYLGCIPRAYEAQDVTFTAAVTYGWVVDEKYRAFAPLLLDAYFDQPEISVFLSSTVNSQSSATFTSFGSNKVPVGMWDRSLFWITNSRGFTRSWVAIKQLRNAAFLSYILGPGIAITSACRTVKNAPIRQGLKLEECTRFDKRFDTFWTQYRSDHADVFLADRSLKVLNWHFKYPLLTGRIWILCINDGSKLLGYAIFSRQDNSKIGLKRMRLADYCFLDDDEELLAPMLDFALQRCRKERIHMLECVGLGGSPRRIAKQLGARERLLPCWMFYYMTHNPSLSKLLAHQEAWRPTLLDGDSSL